MDLIDMECDKCKGSGRIAFDVFCPQCLGFGQRLSISTKLLKDILDELVKTNNRLKEIESGVESIRRSQ